MSSASTLILLAFYLFQFNISVLAFFGKGTTLPPWSVEIIATDSEKRAVRAIFEPDAPNQWLRVDKHTYYFVTKPGEFPPLTVWRKGPVIHKPTFFKKQVYLDSNQMLKKARHGKQVSIRLPTQEQEVSLTAKGWFRGRPMDIIPYSVQLTVISAEDGKQKIVIVSPEQSPPASITVQYPNKRWFGFARATGDHTYIYSKPGEPKQRKFLNFKVPKMPSLGGNKRKLYGWLDQATGKFLSNEDMAKQLKSHDAVVNGQVVQRKWEISQATAVRHAPKQKANSAYEELMDYYGLYYEEDEDEDELNDMLQAMYLQGYKTGLTVGNSNSKQRREN